jgi:hypothetical protein
VSAPAPIRITATEPQRRLGWQAAREVRDWAAATGARSYFAPRNQLVEDACGFAAEIVVAEVLGVPWRYPDPYTRHDGDLVDGTEVRSTRYPRGALLLRPEDDPERAYVLVTGRPPKFVVRGWILGRDGMRCERWWPRAPQRPCWRVPQEHLCDVAARWALGVAS